MKKQKNSTLSATEIGNALMQHNKASFIFIHQSNGSNDITIACGGDAEKLGELLFEVAVDKDNPNIGLIEIATINYFGLKLATDDDFFNATKDAIKIRQQMDEEE